MNYKIFAIVFLFLYSCTATNINNKSIETSLDKTIFSNKGFALVFNEDLKKNKIINKTIDDRSLVIFQKNLKKNTSVKITNLLNNKSILAKVGPKSNYPNFYNSVISKRIYAELDMSESEPYIQISSVSVNSTFLAKKAKIIR